MALRSKALVRAIALAALTAALVPSGACSHARGGTGAHKRAAMVMTLTEQNDGSEVRAKVGDTLDIRLPENATTGYRWEPDTLDTHLLQLETSAGDYPSGKPGSGGNAHFQVKVLAAGHTALSFKLWRRWEGDAGVIRRFTVKVTTS